MPFNGQFKSSQYTSREKKRTCNFISNMQISWSGLAYWYMAGYLRKHLTTV